MGLKRWYDAHVMPRLITRACGQPGIEDRRRAIVPLARGRVFELGCGGGLNQALYDHDRVTAFSGIDPHGKLLARARQRAEARGWPVDIRQGAGEDIPFPDGSFDTVVCTYTLCSVDDPARVMAEMHRVLAPGGQLLFLEHGRAPDAGAARTTVETAGGWLQSDAPRGGGAARCRFRGRTAGPGLSRQGAARAGVDGMGRGAQGLRAGKRSGSPTLEVLIRRRKSAATSPAWAWGLQRPGPAVP